MRTLLTPARTPAHAALMHLNAPPRTTAPRHRPQGLVFVPLSQPYLHEYGDDWMANAPRRLVDKALNSLMARPGQQIIVLSQVLVDDINTGYQQFQNLQVRAGRRCVLGVGCGVPAGAAGRHLQLAQEAAPHSRASARVVACVAVTRVGALTAMRARHTSAHRCCGSTAWRCSTWHT